METVARRLLCMRPSRRNPSSLRRFSRHRGEEEDERRQHHQPLQLLREVVVDGVGGLDEMESALDQLDIQVSPSLVSQVFDSCDAGAGDTRRLLRFFAWSRRRTQDALWGDPFTRAIRTFAARGDAPAMGILISDLQRDRRHMEADTFAFAAEFLVKLGRPDDCLRLLKMQGAAAGGRRPITSERILAVVHALCGRGHAERAAGLVGRYRGELGAAEMAAASRSLLHGWCVGRNAREARKVLEEMKSAGARPGRAAYDALLRCLCERNLKFNPSALGRRRGPRPVSGNILLSCLARARRVKEAYSVLQSMRRAEGKRPRVLYLTGRFIRGNRVIRQMLEDGVAPEPRFFRRLVGLLCGVESLDIALEVFDHMRGLCAPQDCGPVYDLLIAKLCRSGKFDSVRRLWDDAAARGVLLGCSRELLDSSKTEVFEPAKTEKETGRGLVRVSSSRERRKKMKKLKKMKKRRST
ncbi:unnamed protein product [Spirodela intermedia]|uniref:Uncharacterized protein n=1 Tax=Spirodela intermedia TaxID=51605 RepID=A0A7I8J9Z2_SPIIN|nr:unnamed protein product [Spirodela intermedia]CAA6666910.1 unnamed protein product [Spirodela intermedia]